MNDAKYYAFKKGNVRFFALDSNYMDAKQLAWLEKQLQAPGTKIGRFVSSITPFIRREEPTAPPSSCAC
jgi:hypothetical protein